MTRSPALYLLAAACIAALPGTALSQWQWRDEAGRRVFSDTPPPPSVPNRNIIAAPGRMAGAYVPTEAEARAGANGGKDGGTDGGTNVEARADGNAGKPASATRPQTTLEAQKEGFEKRRAARLKQEADDAAREAKLAQRTARCQELSNYATGLSQGQRIATIGPDGARQVLDDAERAAALARTNVTIAQECGA